MNFWIWLIIYIILAILTFYFAFSIYFYLIKRKTQELSQKDVNYILTRVAIIFVLAAVASSILATFIFRTFF